jgi:photosystem II stability/assembly factor-like uncharacterized protein
MKKLLFVSSILIFNFYSISFSQSGWQWFNPYPTGQSVQSISFINANTGMAVTSSGSSILWTTNGGTNWNTNRPFNNSGYFSCLMINANTGFAGEYSDYNTVKIIRTTNGGQNWEINFNTELYSIGIHSIVKYGNVIYACGGHIWLKSTNNGETWIMNTVGYYPMDIRSIQFIDINTGFICGTGNPNFINKTTNGGISWFSIFQDSVSSNFWSVMFKNENTGFVCSSENRSVRTTNGGFNWINYPNQLSGSGDFIGDNMIIKDYYSTNFGLNWIYSQNDSYFQKFADSNTCYSCGNDYHTIWKSTNKGINWAKISNNTLDNCRELKICNKNIIYAIKSNSILKSTNSGLNFSQKYYNNSYVLSIMDFTDSLNGVVAGCDGRVLTTTNGGNNWISSTIGNYGLIKIYVNGDKIVLLDSASTSVFISTNFGINWSTINISSDRGRLMKFVNSNVGFILNYGNKLYKTTNGGFNWNIISSTIGAYSFDFLNENTGVLSGSTKYFRTFNSGVTWDTLYYPSNLIVQCIKFINFNSIIAAGLNGRIFKSSNSGLNWFELNAYPSIDIYYSKITFLDSLFGFVHGWSNILMTTTGGEINVGIKIVNIEVPLKHSLSQNYPNPFNPSTNIRYQIANNRYVRLSIYDILGKEIETLVNEKQAPGTYEVTFNGAEYSSGVYFYKLTAVDYSETKKMILLK